MNVTSTELQNNFKVIFAQDNTNPLICLQLYVRVGSAWENSDEAGFSHFTEHLVFKSTKKFPENSIMERVTFLGGSINAYTEYDTTCFYITLPSSFQKEGLEILSELALHADYNEYEFTQEKKVVIEEMKQFQNDPEDYFIEEIAEKYFKKNPYKYPIIGNLKNLQSATRKDLKNFYAKYYSPNNCFLVVSGDFDEEEILTTIDSFFLNWKSAKVEKIEPITDPLHKKPAVFSISKKISNDMLAFVLPDLSETNPDSYALSIATKTFAIGKNSRLYNRLFTEEKLIDAIRVNSLSGINDGASILMVMPKKNADLTKICEIFLQELDQFHKFGITDLELNDQIKELLFYHRYSFEYVESLASSLGGEEVLTGFESFFEYPDKVRSVKRQKINDIISKYFAREHLYIFHKGTGKLLKENILAKINSQKKMNNSKILNDTFLQTTLANGMKVILKRVIGKPTIGITLSFEVSQLNERKENRGINLLASGMLMYGNEKRNYQQFLNFCTTNGINFGISPQAETTSIKMKCFKEMLPMSLELMSDVVNKPTFPNDHFQNLKNTYISNLDRENDYPTYLATKKWKKMIFGKNSNILSRSGTKSSIRSISMKQIKNWYKKYYQPDNISMAIVGDFDFDLTLQQLEKLFSTNINFSELSPQKVLCDSSARRFLRTKINNDQSIINIGGFGCSAKEKQKNTAFHVLAQIIGGDTNSLLFDEIREKRGLAYSIEFSFHSVRDFGYFSVFAIVDKSREKEAIDAIYEILQDVRKNGLSKKDLQKTKNYIRGLRLMEEESMLNQALTLSVLESIGFGYEYYKKRDERLDMVTLKMMHEIAEEYFVKENYFVHILS